MVAVNEQFVLGKCEYFVDVHLWPLESEMNPAAWLSNFNDDERTYAVHLLNAFMYFNAPLMQKMFLNAFQGLSTLLCNDDETFHQSKLKWATFFDNVIITRVTGEEPNDTDSGYLYSRMSRQILEVPEEQVLNPEEALLALLSGQNRPIVFVDDFVGSGEQFIKTWEREWQIPKCGTMSFQKMYELNGGDFYYCNLVCTSYGARRISSRCPGVEIGAAHLLPDTYNMLHPKCPFWPDDLRPSVKDFIYNTSIRAGVEDCWRGFYNLGLALAFEGSVPDATLPIFYSTNNNWRPLIKRK